MYIYRYISICSHLFITVYSSHNVGKAISKKKSPLKRSRGGFVFGNVADFLQLSSKLHPKYLFLTVKEYQFRLRLRKARIWEGSFGFW